MDRKKPAAETADEACETLIIRLHGQQRETTCRAGDTLLDRAHRAGLRRPFSCLAGNCASCMAKITVGAATMRANHVLTPDEVADGYVLTCQALPVSEHVTVVYED
ncbi:MAG: 2Fe-2S iron-sulfur cluster-binding protein [Rhizomicrobium sp.]